MPSTVLYESGDHRNVLLEDFGHGQSVQANQHLVVHGGRGMILDPGGARVFPRAVAEATALMRGGRVQHVFLSHQDPDVVAAVDGWLRSTDAVAWCSALWVRFVPHLGLDRSVEDRLRPIPDERMYLNLGGAELMVLPAHYLHSCGNFHVYDPTSKILYSGDLGGSLGTEEVVVSDFEAHRRFMAPFHRRYMSSSRALRAWVRMVRTLDVETIAPQHGALFCGREMVARFLDWCEGLECGIDAYEGLYQVPPR